MKRTIRKKLKKGDLVTCGFDGFESIELSQEYIKKNEIPHDVVFTEKVFFSKS